MINKIHDIVLNDPKVNEKALCKMGTIDQKRIRVTTFEQNLVYFNRNPKEFLRRFVAIDETWIHHYTPESRKGAKQWVKPGESVPKRLETQQWARKVMGNIFWNAHGVIFIDYLEKGRTITGVYYNALLDQLVDEIRKKRPHLMKKIILFYDNTAPSHTSNVAQAKHRHLPYSPNLAPSDYYLFPNFKR